MSNSIFTHTSHSSEEGRPKSRPASGSNDGGGMPNCGIEWLHAIISIVFLCVSLSGLACEVLDRLEARKTPHVNTPHHHHKQALLRWISLVFCFERLPGQPHCLRTKTTHQKPVHHGTIARRLTMQHRLFLIAQTPGTWLCAVAKCSSTLPRKPEGKHSPLLPDTNKRQRIVSHQTTC